MPLGVCPVHCACAHWCWVPHQVSSVCPEGEASSAHQRYFNSHGIQWAGQRRMMMANNRTIPFIPCLCSEWAFVRPHVHTQAFFCSGANNKSSSQLRVARTMWREVGQGHSCVHNCIPHPGQCLCWMLLNKLKRFQGSWSSCCQLGEVHL